MSVQSICIVESQYAASSAVSVYVSPASTYTIIDRFTAQNNDSSSHTLSVYLVPSGGSADATNLLLNAQTVGNGATVDFSSYLQHTLNPGDSISVLASTASQITIRASGRQVT